MLKPVLHKINFVECKSYGFNLEVDFAWEPTVFWVDITVTVQAENVSCVLAVYMPFWQASLMTWQMHVSPLNQLPLTYRGSKLTCTIFQSRFRVPAITLVVLEKAEDLTCTEEKYQATGNSMFIYYHTMWPRELLDEDYFLFPIRITSDPNMKYFKWEVWILFFLWCGFPLCFNVLLILFIYLFFLCHSPQTIAKSILDDLVMKDEVFTFITLHCI